MGAVSIRFSWRITLALFVWLWSCASLHAENYATDSYPEPAEDRVGKSYWARPPLSETSVDFFKRPELRERLPLYHKTRFRVTEIQAVRPFPNPELVYQVRLHSGEAAYIGVDEFERLLFREPKGNQVVTSVVRPPGGVGVHVHIFERSGIFSADPDVIWQRIRNDGPRNFTPAAPR